MTLLAGSPHSGLSNTSIPLVTALRRDAQLHRGIVRAMETGIASADSNALPFAPQMTSNLLRFIYMNNDLAALFSEQRFLLIAKGIQTLFRKKCEVTRTTVEIRLMRGKKLNYDEFEVFSVNPKSDNLALRVAENFSSSGLQMSLFAMEELVQISNIGSSKSDTLVLFWEPLVRHDRMEAEEVQVYLAKPVSIDDDKILIQCEWVDKIGSFALADVPTINVVPNLAGPVYEPEVMPRVGDEDETIVRR